MVETRNCFGNNFGNKSETYFAVSPSYLVIRQGGTPPAASLEKERTPPCPSAAGGRGSKIRSNRF